MTLIPGSRMADDVATRFEVPIELENAFFTKLRSASTRYLVAMMILLKLGYGYVAAIPSQS